MADTPGDTTIPRRFLMLAIFLAAAACALGVPAGPPGGRMARFSPTDRDPVGFLLLNRDSIGLPDSTVQRLVQLNLRLFRRNQPLQNEIDSAMRDVHLNTRERADSSAIPEDVRARIGPLAAQIRSQTAAVKDTAWSWLNERERLRADSLDARQAAILRRGQPPVVSGGGPARP
jgi:hypothetical protein